MAGPEHPRHHGEAFKRQIVQSRESGKPSREIRAGHDIAQSTLRRWVQGIRDSGSARACGCPRPGWSRCRGCPGPSAAGSIARCRTRP